MKLLYTLAITIFFTSLLHSQNIDTTIIPNTASIELNRARSLWFNSSNTAGLVINPLTDYNTVSIKYNNVNGDYKLQQQGDSENAVVFNTNGALKLGRFMLWGDFKFKNDFINSSRFNTNLIDIHSAIPYYIADANMSDWKNQLYDMSFKASTSLFSDRVALGINANYHTKKGAKQVDPRSIIYSYGLLVQPSIIFKLKDHHYVGLSFIYQNTFDKSYFTNSDSQNNQEVYIMKGLGNFNKAIIGGIGGLDPFYYKGNKIGGGLQYGILGNVDILLDVCYNYKVVNVYQNPSKPQRMGSTKQNKYNAKLQILINSKPTHKLTLNAHYVNTDGIEYIQEYDRSYEINEWVTLAKFVKSNYKIRLLSLNYDLFTNALNDYSWNFGFKSIYSNKFDEYYLPNSIFKVNNLFGELYLRKNIKFKSGLNILLGSNLGYNFNINGEYTYNGSSNLSLIVKDFYSKDLDHLSTNYSVFGAMFDFAFPVNNKSMINIGGKWSYVYSSEKQNRSFKTISLSLIF